jgi:hypothetical protein
MAAVSNTAITNSKPIALTAPQVAKPITGGASVGVLTIANNPPGAGRTGGIIKNPLGRLGR